MADCAASFAIDRLFQLLEEESKLLRGVRREVESLRAELQIIQPYLRDADERAERGEIHDGLKALAKQVRQVSYRIEDVMDGYILYLAQRPQRGGLMDFLCKIDCVITKLEQRHEIASEIQDIRTSIREIRERINTYGLRVIDDGSSSRRGWKSSASRHGSPMASLVLDEAEVVGIESARDTLISWMVKEASSSRRMVISVVGTGGVGKTTLVKKVYDKQVSSGTFVCHAWIPVSESYKIEKILVTLLKQLHKATTKELSSPPAAFEAKEMMRLIRDVREYLQDKRYVIAFDDVWDIEFWRSIKHVLPDNNNGSQVIITTCKNDVASSCKESQRDLSYELQPMSEENAFQLFCKKAFQSDSRGGFCPPELEDLSHKFVKRCGGLPLAIVAIGGLLSTKGRLVPDWQKFYDSLGSELETDPRLIDIRRILSLSYLDLPHYLKPCFLYFGIFPEDNSVSCMRLVRLWMAEGFVKEKRGKTLEEIAQDYLGELIHRNLVQVSWVDFDGKVRSCRIHDAMREIILSKFRELNFCQLLTEENCNFDGEMRRLSIDSKVSVNVVNNIHIEYGRIRSLIRSFFMFQKSDLPDSFVSKLVSNFKLLKVLDFEDAPLNSLPEELGNLLHLGYLSVRNTKVKTLPKSLGKLYNLITLDLKNSLVSELPIEINKLHKIRHLLAYYNDEKNDGLSGSRRGVKLQAGFGHLKALQKLCFVGANDGQRDLDKLRMLRQLKKLGIKKLKFEEGKALCQAIENMSQLESLDICSDETLDLQHISFPSQSLQRLYLFGRLEKFPQWISQLKRLVRIGLYFSGLKEDPLQFIKALPMLLELRLVGAYDSQRLCFDEGGFHKLKVLQLRNLNAVNSVVIEKGAMPLLQELHIGPCPQLNEVPSGIQHLTNLTTLRFIDMPDQFAFKMIPHIGPLYHLVQHIPTVHFLYKGEGGRYTAYSLRSFKI